MDDRKENLATAVLVIIVVLAVGGLLFNLKAGVTGYATVQTGSEVIIQSYVSISRSQNLSDGISFGTISTFSFYSNKHVTCGEGGMVLVDDEQLAERCRLLRNLFFQPQQRFVHECHHLGR